MNSTSSGVDNFVNFGAIAAGVGALGFSTGVKNALIQEATKTVVVGKGAAKYLKYSKGLGSTLGAIGMIGTYAQYSSGEIGGSEATADIIMGAIGFVPGWGWAVSGGYFLGKATYQYATKP